MRGDPIFFLYLPIYKTAFAHYTYHWEETQGMEKQEIINRISKKEEQIKKIEARVKKWQDAKCEAGYIKQYAGWWTPKPKSIKTMDDLIKARYDYFNGTEDMDTCTKRTQDSYEGFLKDCDNEIRYAQRDLDDANATLAKYKVELDKANNYDNEEKVKPIWDFLMGWRSQAYEWYIKHAEYYFGLQQGYREAKGKFMQSNPNATYWQKREWESSYYRYVDQLTKDITHIKTTQVKDPNSQWGYYYEPESYTVDEEMLNKALDKEVKTKYTRLIEEITHITGTITDAKGLSIGGKGDINGVVIGNQGKAKVLTFPAGIHWIIQRPHYRTKITKVD